MDGTTTRQRIAWIARSYVGEMTRYEQNVRIDYDTFTVTAIDDYGPDMIGRATEDDVRYMGFDHRFDGNLLVEVAGDEIEALCVL